MSGETSREAVEEEMVLSFEVWIGERGYTAVGLCELCLCTRSSVPT